MAYRLTGSSDLYEHSGRRPYASINFVTVHDGFTLRDLVSYNEKHNEANGEHNRDGSDDNLSWNCGAEGPTEDRGVLALRARQWRNFQATLFLSQGVPMLLGGDEFGRTQQGNNNTYCQDNEISWTNWELDDSGREFLEFARFAIKVFHDHPVLRRRKFYQRRKIRGSEVKDLTWFRPDGKEMTEDDWNNPEVRCFGLRLAGDAIEELDQKGERITDDTLLLVLNADHEPAAFRLPHVADTAEWRLVLDTREAASGQREQTPIGGGEAYGLEARSLAMLKLGAQGAAL